MPCQNCVSLPYGGLEESLKELLSDGMGEAYEKHTQPFLEYLELNGSETL